MHVLTATVTGGLDWSCTTDYLVVKGMQIGRWKLLHKCHRECFEATCGRTPLQEREAISITLLNLSFFLHEISPLAESNILYRGKKLNSVCMLTVSIAVKCTDQYMSEDENWPVSF